MVLLDYIILHYIGVNWCVCSPVEGVRVQIQHLQWSSIRLISKLMNRQPLFILSYYTNLKCIKTNRIVGH